MIPLTDNNPTHVPALVTWAMLGLCALVFLWQVGGAHDPQAVVYEYGFIPAFTLGGELDPEGLNSGWRGVFTSMFLHGDIAHLAGNMLYLWVFGDNIEQALGRVKFLLFYLVCGVCAALTQGMLDVMSVVPMIGASGAISGILGAYLVLHPRQPITVALPYVGITHLPAWAVLGAWFGYQLLYGLAVPQEGGGVAFWAHVGGFVAGVLFILPFGGRGGGRRVQLWED
jgi:membrane associated rhomboid family serine protease